VKHFLTDHLSLVATRPLQSGELLFVRNLDADLLQKLHRVELVVTKAPDDIVCQSESQVTGDGLA